MNLEDYRNYEVSIWTLQDSFITVLKHTNVELKGQVQNPIIKLKDDGTEEFSFSIPMYLTFGNKQIENPIWYNTTNGNLIVDLRKIKVICDKGTTSEHVFEFIITKITETHEKDILTCKIECSGLAFHELGKVGYKISLLTDDFYEDYDKWIESTDINKPAEFIANLQYWMDKVLKYKQDSWTYSIQMDWSGYDGTVLYQFNGSPARVGYAWINYSTISSQNTLLYSDIPPDSREELNAAREAAGYRRYDRIYEDPYVTSWTLNDSGNQIIGAGYENFKEKARLVNLEESNIYNLTQNLAEVFGVFCKYKYTYDNNYHIIGREIIFYNNFLYESEGAQDITYRYHTSNITRIMDATDTITKMFVKPINDANFPAGMISIADAAVNKTLEDYILNFEYMYQTGAISEDQYNYINEFEARIRQINTAIIPIQSQLASLRTQLSDAEGDLQFHKNALVKDEELLAQSADLLNSITEGSGIIQITAANPKSGVLISITDAINMYSLSLPTNTKGIDFNTLHIYKNYSVSNKVLSDEINIENITPILDDKGNLVQLKINIQLSEQDSKIVYLIYNYSPQLWYERVYETYNNRVIIDNTNVQRLQELVELLQTNIDEAEEIYQNKLQQKNNLWAQFELVLGPAVREGTWQPDDYSDYGEQHSDLIDPNTPAGLTNFIWDAYESNSIFVGERGLTYEVGADTQEQFYQAVMFPTQDLDAIIQHYDTVGICYDMTKTGEKVYRQHLMLGSGCEIAFIGGQNAENIMPVFLLIGAVDIGEVPQNANLTISYFDNNNNENIISAATLVPNLNNYIRYYPRIQINSLKVKISEDQFNISYMKDNEQVNLTMFEDYSILTDESSYYFTLKPYIVCADKLNCTYKVDYWLSNADTLIYLDALNIAQENAWPKVSYTVNWSAYNNQYTKKFHKLLDRIVHINDSELKFENVYGYISELTLDLDHPWKDQCVIKNYKNKFEDLFSTIVAQTEQMKKNEPILNSLYNYFSNGGLDATVLKNTIQNNQNILDAYFDTKFENALDLQNTLQSIALQNDTLINDIQNTINSLSFESSSPIIYTQTVRPTNLRFGDIWNETDANGNLINSYITMDESRSTGYSGLNKIYDGTIKSIEGAKLDIDAQEGSIEIKSASTIDLASDDLQITGNHSVNIGGAKINITAFSLDEQIENSGIYILRETVNGTDIDKTQLISIDDNGIRMRANSPIEFYSADEQNSAAVSINNQKILLGVEDNAGLAGVSLTSNTIQLGTKNQNQQATSFLIGEHTYNNENINGITLASYTSSGQEGSMVQITPDLIKLGSTANLQLNTNNIQLQSDKNNATDVTFALGTNLMSNTPNPSLLFKNGKLYLNQGVYIGDTNNTIIDLNNSVMSLNESAPYVLIGPRCYNNDSDTEKSLPSSNKNPGNVSKNGNWAWWDTSNYQLKTGDMWHETTDDGTTVIQTWVMDAPNGPGTGVWKRQVITLTGLSSGIQAASLNTIDGLKIVNNNGYYLQMNGASFGFYNDSNTLKLGYDSTTDKFFVDGAIYANSGTIANWNISSNSLYTDNYGFNDTNGMYLGEDGLRIGDIIKISADSGALTLKQVIGGRDTGAITSFSVSDTGVTYCSELEARNIFYYHNNSKSFSINNLESFYNMIEELKQHVYTNVIVAITADLPTGIVVEMRALKTGYISIYSSGFNDTKTGTRYFLPSLNIQCCPGVTFRFRGVQFAGGTVISDNANRKTAILVSGGGTVFLENCWIPTNINQDVLAARLGGYISWSNGIDTDTAGSYLNYFMNAAYGGIGILYGYVPTSTSTGATLYRETLGGKVFDNSQANSTGGGSTPATTASRSLSITMSNNDWQGYYGRNQTSLNNPNTWGKPKIVVAIDSTLQAQINTITKVELTLKMYNSGTGMPFSTKITTSVDSSLSQTYDNLPDSGATTINIPVNFVSKTGFTLTLEDPTDAHYGSGGYTYSNGYFYTDGYKAFNTSCTLNITYISN